MSHLRIKDLLSTAVNNSGSRRWPLFTSLKKQTNHICIASHDVTRVTHLAYLKEYKFNCIPSLHMYYLKFNCIQLNLR